MACSGGVEEWQEWWGLRWQRHTELSKQALEADLGAIVWVRLRPRKIPSLLQAYFSVWALETARCWLCPRALCVWSRGRGDSQWIQKTLGSNLSSAAYPAGRSLLREKEKEPF